MSNIKNVIFDLDGTLWDSRAQIIKAWQTINPSINVSVDELSSLMGKTTEDFVKFLFPDSDIKLASNYMEQCERAEVDFLNKHGAILYDGVLELLQSLNEKYNLFIVSNCQDGYIESFLNYYKFNELFDDFECNGKTKLSKSNNIKLIIERNNLLRDETCYIGDTYGALVSAKDNNLKFIWSKYGFGNVETYDNLVNSPLEILKVLYEE